MLGGIYSCSFRSSQRSFPQLYNQLDPPLFGMPFFYWYQLAWTIGSGVTARDLHRVTRGGASNAR